MRFALVLVLIGLVGCPRPRPPPWYGTDGPQGGSQSSSGEADFPGKRCDACFPMTLVAGFVTVPWTALSLALGPKQLARNTNGWYSWTGIGLGATTLALGTTHAVLNRDELGSAAITPLVVSLATGLPAITLGIIGLSGQRDTMVGSMINCRGGRCKPGVPAPIAVHGSPGLAIAGGTF